MCDFSNFRFFFLSTRLRFIWEIVNLTMKEFDLFKTDGIFEICDKFSTNLDKKQFFEKKIF